MKASPTVLVVLGVLLLAGLLAGGRVASVRSAYGEWRLAPSSSPPRFGGRDYHRRGDLYGPARRPYAPTVLELRTPDGITGYSLAGGP